MMKPGRKRNTEMKRSRNCNSAVDRDRKETNVAAHEKPETKIAPRGQESCEDERGTASILLASSTVRGPGWSW
jgi:hypothetical protein